MRICERCGEEKKLMKNMTMCGDCSKEIWEKSVGKRYHPTEVAKKIDDLERRVQMLELKQRSM